MTGYAHYIYIYRKHQTEISIYFATNKDASLKNTTQIVQNLQNLWLQIFLTDNTLCLHFKIVFVKQDLAYFAIKFQV